MNGRGITPSQAADDRIAALFGPSVTQRNTLLVFAWIRNDTNTDTNGTLSNTTLLSPESPLGPLDAFSDRLNKSCVAFGVMSNVSDFILSVDGYSLMLARGFPSEAADAYLAPSHRSTIFPVSFRTNRGLSSEDFAHYLQEQVDGPLWPNQTARTALGLEVMGNDAFMSTIQGSVEHDMALGDGIVIPLAFAMLAFMVRSLRVLLLVLSSLIVAGLTAFGLMYFCTLVLDVMSATLSLMMSLVIALTIDYGLFLMTRFRDALVDGEAVDEALATSLASAGHTILVSGITLTIAFIGLLIVPLDTLGALGVGCGTAVMAVLISNLTFVPAVLLTFSSFFGNVAKAVSPPVDRVALIGDGAHSDGVPHALINSDSTPKPRRTSRVRCCVTWRGFSEWIVRPPVAVVTVLLVCGITAPFGYPALTYSTSQSVEMALPRGADVTEAFLTMSKEFGYGYLNAYTLLVAVPADSNVTVLSHEYYNASRSAVNALVAALPNTTVSMFEGVSTAGGQTIDHTYTEQCLDPNSLFYKLSFCVALRFQFDQDVNANRTASLFTVSINAFDPNAELGFDWYRTFLAVLPEVERNTSLELALTGGPAPGWDSVQMAYDDFPLMIGIVSGTILLVVGIALKSVLIPVRSLLAVALTLGFCYGSASLVYEWGVLDWMGFMGLHTMSPHDRALLWMPPLVSFGIIVGLCLDYDLFLLIRVADYRKSGAGMPNRDAVVLGLCSTGPIITAAGVIMAVAFCGLLFSSTMAMNQLAFFMVSAVLYDTFVVRTLLVPALMSLMGDAVWWPGLKPQHNMYK
jgi:uncharacterized membrane protein YdfJ with MMPL/SSD domain